MSTKKMFALTAIEANGSLTVSARISVTGEAGRTCSRSRELYYDVEEESCCADCWVREVCATLDDPNEAHTWVYEHAKGCEEHEDAHHGA